jgi:transcription antitermination factor NusA-like protein
MKTEADTVGTTMKKNGKLFDMLRKAFHHEKISVSRKTNSEYVEVMNHNSAIALSGTPKQIFNIIPSAEDGLFSRFFFLCFKQMRYG